MPEMTYYWKMFTDIMVFMLPPDEIGQLNEVISEERKREGREGISEDMGMRKNREREGER